MDEPFYDNGTPSNPADDYGRVDYQILKTADSEGAIAYHYQYFTGISAGKVQKKKCYTIADYTNPSSPVLSNLVAIYEFDISGNIISMTVYMVSDNLWHKMNNFTVALGDGKIHAQREEIYSGID
ncbi:MAG: hypothetical protein NTZ95_04860, partial [Candidatus Omnitrophica bacterium]|nr:hypothetical protein [Candidatus Omnitrophota bacterium]